MLISVAAVLSAVCGYQSGRWGGHEAMYYNVANGDRVRSAEAADRANVLTAIDVALFLQYVDAIDAGNRPKARFISARLRPEMKKALDAWLATNPLVNPKAPSSPFVMRQYSLATRADAQRFEATAGANFRRAQEANRHADDFLLLTVIFAGVSFLGGISTKLVYPRHAILVCLGTLGVIYGAVRLVELPFL